MKYFGRRIDIGNQKLQNIHLPINTRLETFTYLLLKCLNMTFRRYQTIVIRYGLFSYRYPTIYNVSYKTNIAVSYFQLTTSKTHEIIMR